MGENSKISWCDHTWNAWTGCSKVSPACANCYAEAWAKRSGLVVWGDEGTRRRTSPAKWREPYKWNKRAKETEVRERVFVNSLSDWAEDRDELIPIRQDMFKVIKDCESLDFLLLTKRADRIRLCLPDDWGKGYPNVHLGVTAENQEWANKRIPHLLSVPAVAHFVSAEPLLGSINLRRLMFRVCADDSPIKPISGCFEEYDALRGELVIGRVGYNCARLDQVIVGGESGSKHRPLDLDHARRLRDQCQAAGVAFFYKQGSGPQPGMNARLDGKQWHEMPV